MVYLKNLKRVREEKGLTQKELAKASGVSAKSIDFLERTCRTAKTRTADKLEAAMNCERYEIW